VPYLEALVNSGFDVVAAISRTPSPHGRRRVLTPTPVAQAAASLGVPVIETNSLRDAALPDCDVAVVVAYGALVPSDLLEHPALGWVNVHFSLLPAYRGAAPLQRSMWNGDRIGGITIFRLVPELDAGPVLFQRAIEYRDDESASEALRRFAHDTTDELVGTLRLLESKAIQPLDQIGEVTFAPKFVREDGRIDWSLPADTIATRIRAVTNEPGAFTLDGDTSFGVLEARAVDVESGEPGSVSEHDGRILVGTGAGSLELVTVKPAGKSAMSARDWFRGRRGTVSFA
jgi:methionyl-tRNA formyltransferase